MRVFAAIDVEDQGVLQAIHGVQSELGLARPVAAQNMHFTLQFLGEVSRDRIPGVCSALKTVAFSPFEVEIAGVGAFPRPETPRVIWAGTDLEGGQHMRRLAGNIQSVLEPLGFVPDKAFKPHLTVFRIKNRIGSITRDLNKFGGIKFGMMTVSQFKLKQSNLTPSGPVYSDLEVVAAE